MNKKHFIIYYKKGTGTYIVTEPRPWARENQHYFDGNIPRTNTIIKFLTETLNFVTIEYPHVKLTFNHDPDIQI